MTLFLAIGQMLAGIAIFMLGMNFMEESLRSLAGRKFKLLLKRQTSGKFKAIAGGAGFSALLQSSSIVNLLVLSLAGAGIIQLRNALAVMLGSNLGTTLTSWIIATLGFSFNIESYAFPLAGIAGISLVFFRAQSRWYQWARFLLGFTFLFIGLGFIKTGMMELVQRVDLAVLQQYPLAVFVVTGMLMTGIIQSSSATVAIALSALYAGAISLPVAMAIVLGSEIGTTFKLFLASVKGIPVKKRLALGNFLINVGIAIVLLPFLRPIHSLITDVMGIGNELVALVLFQSLVNFTAIILFYPLLNTLAGFLEKRFSGGEEETLFIHKVNHEDTTIALEALEKESRSFIYHVLDLYIRSVNVRLELPAGVIRKNYFKLPLMEKYAYIKQLHGEILGFYIQLQKDIPTGKESERPEQLISSVRNSMYGAKNIRDGLHDIEQLHQSSNDTKYGFYLKAQQKMGSFCEKVKALLEKPVGPDSLDLLTRFHREVQRGYTDSLKELYWQGMESRLSEQELSTVINFNRETYTAFKSMIFALKDYLLDAQAADKFDELPGFIR